MPAQTMEELVSLCKRRGFIFQGSEIYGGLQGTYDYGPLGVELKKNLKEAWWKANIYERDDMEGLDASVLMHRMVLRHSGHESTFSDPMVDHKTSKKRYRLDHLLKDQTPEVRLTVAQSMGLESGDDLTEMVSELMKDGEKAALALSSAKVLEPEGNTGSDWTAPRPFNMMFRTTVGPVADDDSYAYLRPETAQGIFVNFKNVVDSTSRRLPFGIAQIGKAFRNEITPRNFIFRVREFEQMEIEFFVKPGEDELWHEKWLEARLSWWDSVGIPRHQIEILDVPKADLAHYSKRTYDLMYNYPSLGFEEIEGIANRTDYDLGSHTRSQGDMNLSATVLPNEDSTQKLTILEQTSNKHIVPFVIEPSAGVDRAVLAVLSEAYTQETLENGNERIVLKLRPHLAPIKVAVIPLARNKIELVETARKIKQDLQKLAWGRILLEDSGNVGKAYRRHDEVGTPFCVTVDYGTLGGEAENAELVDTVTVRNRDTMLQDRVAITDLAEYLRSRLFN